MYIRLLINRVLAMSSNLGLFQSLITFPEVRNKFIFGEWLSVESDPLPDLQQVRRPVGRASCQQQPKEASSGRKKFSRKESCFQTMLPENTLAHCTNRTLCEQTNNKQNNNNNNNNLHNEKQQSVTHFHGYSQE